jgi:hypothetical protein
MYLYIIGISILLLLAIIFIIFTTSKNKIDRFIYNKFIVECVISRYNEPISWIYSNRFNHIIDKYSIYNKGVPLNINKHNTNVIVHNIKNVGKCDHTFLYHIINNYDNLADITVFVSSNADNARKGPKIVKTIDLVGMTYNTVMIGSKLVIPDDIYNFSMDTYRSQNPDNYINDGLITQLTPSKIRPFGKWYSNFWPDKKNNIVIYGSIFAVHKSHIIQHPLNYYKRLIEEVNYCINPEAGHYVERAWSTIFSPYSESCKYYIDYM